VKTGRPPKADTMERDLEVVKHRLAGHNFEEIAQLMGYASRGAAYNSYRRAMQTRIAQNIDELREEEVSRLDEMLKVLWPTIIDDPTNWDTENLKPRDLEVRVQRFHGAIDRALKIAEARRKIVGMDAPTRTEVKVEGTEDEKLAAALQALEELKDKGNDSTD
jgi:transposase